MKNVIVSLVAVAGMAAAANAQGNLEWSVSTDGVLFSNDFVNANPGQTVVVRATMSYTGTAAPLGLASFVFQPTLSNYDTTGAGAQLDTLLPFIAGGMGSNTTNPVGVVPPGEISGTDGPWGRISPWGRTSITSSGALRGHVHSGGSGGAPAGSWLRIAQSHVTSWLGGTGNTTGGSGVPISQLNDNGRTTNDPAFNPALQGIIVFQYAITLSDDTAVRTLVADSPVDAWGNRNSTTGVRESYWFATMVEGTGSLRGGNTVGTAEIRIIPTPASLALLGLGGLAIARRRR